jgi:predicted metal-binding membrane protein
LETIAQRDRLVLLSALVGISAIAWAYTIAMSSDPGHGAHVHILAEPRAWTGTDFAMTFGMWTVMMLAMMLPTTPPMVLSLAKISRDKSAARSPMAPATGFLIGYAIVMTAFSLVAAVAQWGFHQAAWTSITGESTSRVFAAAVLLGAGGFQFTRLKDACLRRCRSPLWFLMTQWRPGSVGGMKMGIAHGRFSRSFLHRLLLGADGVDVRRRIDESALDGGACALHVDREGSAGGPDSGANRRGRTRGMGSELARYDFARGFVSRVSEGSNND